MTGHIGRCRCDGVRIASSGETHFSGYCHCDDCRRSNGAPIVAFAGFEKSQIQWDSKETLGEWRNGNFARLFCTHCGSPVAYTDDRAPEVVFFYTGFMAKPEQFSPEHHSYHNEKLSWLLLADDLQKFNETSYQRPE